MRTKSKQLSEMTMAELYAVGSQPADRGMTVIDLGLADAALAEIERRLVEQAQRTGCTCTACQRLRGEIE